MTNSSYPVLQPVPRETTSRPTHNAPLTITAQLTVCGMCSPKHFSCCIWTVMSYNWFYVAAGSIYTQTQTGANKHWPISHSDIVLELVNLVANLHWFYIWSVSAEREGRISRAIAQLCIKYCNPHNKMGDISEFKRGQIVVVCLTGSSTRKSSLCGVLRDMVSRVMSVYQHVQ